MLIVVLVVLLLVGQARAQAPAVLFFDSSWCPRPEELVELSKYMNIRKNGCCIRQALVFSEYRGNSELRERWGHRFSANNTFDDACTGRVLTVEEDAAAVSAKRQQRAEEEARLLAGQRLREQEAEREQQEAEREEVQRRRDAPKTLRTLPKDDFCLAVGTAIRTSLVAGIGNYPELPDLIKKEAARRGLTFDYGLVASAHIRLGISECQLLASWGESEHRNRTVGSWGVHIQHVYNGGRNLVYTENGVVKSWQD